MSQHHPRFLVLRGGAIGDFVVTLPALRLLRDRWPDAYIELRGYPHIAALAEAAGLVDRVQSLDKAGMAQLFAPGIMPDAECCEYLQSFDLLVSYLYDPDGVFRTNVEKAGVRQVLYGSPLAGDEHMVDHLLRPLCELALFPDGPLKPELVLSPVVVAAGEAWLRERGLGRALAIHPGSGSPTKNWPVSRFMVLAERAAVEASMTPFFIIGEADRDIARTVADAAPGMPLLQDRTLVEVAGVLACSGAYLGNDSGITHIAGAVGVPVVALFGPSFSAQWCPRGRQVRVVDAPSGNLAELSVDQVWDALVSVSG